MEQIRHRINKYKARFAPLKRDLQKILMQGDIESVLISAISCGLEPYRHPIGIAVLATCRDFATASNGIPCRISPFYLGNRCHNPCFSYPSPVPGPGAWEVVLAEMGEC